MVPKHTKFPHTASKQGGSGCTWLFQISLMKILRAVVITQVIRAHCSDKYFYGYPETT